MIGASPTQAGNYEFPINELVVTLENLERGRIMPFAFDLMTRDGLIVTRPQNAAFT